MKVRIDVDNCTSCGLCVDSVPDVFKMGEEVAEVMVPSVPVKLEAEVRDAAEYCPTEAIIIED